MQAFGSGATRSADTHKIDFEGHLSPEALHYFGDYMNRHRFQRDGTLRDSDNWQKGIPLHKYMKSLLRHTFELWRVWRGREVTDPDSLDGKPFIIGDLLAAIIFNAQGMLHELIEAHSTHHTFVTKEFRLMIERAGE